MEVDAAFASGGELQEAGSLMSSATLLAPVSRSSRSRSGHASQQKKQQPADGSKLLRNDEVYHQLFTSQVQLADQLAATRWWRENRPKVKVAKSTRDLSLPVVRNAVARGMLDDPQSSWARATENDTRTRNPVADRQLAEWLDLVGSEPDGQRHAGEVADLPDIVRPSKLKSDVIDRIKEKRRERHNMTLEEMHQELYQVGVAFEPQYSEHCRQLQQLHAECDAELQRLLAPIEEVESLAALTHEQLQSLWQQLASVFEQRREAVRQLDLQLRQLEETRVGELRDIFRNYSDVMERVSHLAPAELHRIIDEEAMQVNQMLLSNQRNLSDLSARLLMAELEKERKVRATWETKLAEWCSIHAEEAVASFAEFMRGERVQRPESLEAIFAEMRSEQEQINNQRLQLIEEIKTFVPPNATKSKVASWYQQMQRVCKQLDEANQRHLRRVYEDYERICQSCLQEMQQLQARLVEAGVSTQEEAEQLTMQRCLPLISEQQRQFEQKLGSLDQLFEASGKRVSVQLKSLYKLAQGACHLWDRHELSLGQLERELVDRLNSNREEHNRQNQDKEVQLDIVMDKLRQECTEAGLKQQLGKAHEMLKMIESTYHRFHSEQQLEVRAYPKLVDEEVDGLEQSVCEYFGLERNSKKKVERKKTKAALKAAELAKIKAAQEAHKSEEDEWVRTAFREILLTSRGSEFRVLTEAGVHGIPPPEEATTGGGEGKHGYITLLPPDPSDRAAEEDENVRSATISRRVVLEAKVEIRQNFLDFVDSWRTDAAQRSSGVVQAKLEELEAELRLRLHLHEPRPRRAEQDVHNVRAAELVLHSERVTRHTKGVQQALDQMKAEFTEMNEEHDTLMAQFIAKIESMEEAYSNATKSTRLASLSSQCSSEVESLMSSIRTSLRQFRQSLDEKLQMLREANAKFIKSLKLFSEGGNFCPEEVDDCRKKLDKMTSKVDLAESSILSELEGMEKKRLDAANAKVKQFEEQFRHHMVDLVFMEKVSRWLTNSQVRIKSEVADSNSQALKLEETLNSLERRIDACLRPNLDKENVLPHQLHTSLHAVFEMFSDRSVYLNCIGTQRSPPVVVTIDQAPLAQESAAGGGGGSGEAKLVRLPATEPTAASKAGKQPAEDPAAGVIKKILRSQRQRVHGAEVVIDVEKDDTAQAGRERKSKKKSQAIIKEPDASLEASPAAPVSDNTHTPSLQGQNSVTKMPDSAAKNSRRGSHVAEQQQLPPNRRTSASRKFVSKNQRLDKKYMVFGEAEEPHETQHFLGRVRRVCREALDGTLLAAEVYYRQKGSRPVTRPQALHESFDQCAETLISKLQSYFMQADEYHNSCVIELRQQLERLERLVDEIPQLTFKDLFGRYTQTVQASLARLDKEAAGSVAELQRRRQRHEEALSPALGHPERLLQLQQLCEQEQQRHEQLVSLLAKLLAQKQEALLKEADAFAGEVSQTAEMLFLKLDSLLTADEVERGRQPVQLEATATLLRKQLAGQPLEDPNKHQLIARGKANWLGLPLNEFQLLLQQQQQGADTGGGQAGKGLQRATLVVTAKTTMPHNRTDSARRQFYQAFKEFFEQTLQQVRQQSREAETLEARWFENWENSVQRIRSLY